MVLEFGLLKTNLFPASDAAGEGMTSNTDETIRKEATGKQIFTVYSDCTSAGISNSTTETTLATYAIPANTVSNGIIVFVKGNGMGFNTGGNSKLRLYIGPTGSETNVQTESIAVSDHGTHDFSLLYEDTSQTWSNEITVKVTGKNARNSPNDKTNCHSLVIVGF